jgi:hypothetical protein
MVMIQMKGKVKHLDVKAIPETISQNSITYSLGMPALTHGTQVINRSLYTFLLEYIDGKAVKEKHVNYKGDMNGVLSNGDYVQVEGQDVGGILHASAIYDIQRQAWIVSK